MQEHIGYFFLRRHYPDQVQGYILSLTYGHP